MKWQLLQPKQTTKNAQRRSASTHNAQRTTHNAQRTTHNAHIIVAEPHVQAVQQLLAQNLKHPWTVQELAAAVQLSRRQLERLFWRELQITPSEYLLQQRMEKACALLVTRFDLVKEIAAQVGLPDVNHFIRVFKKRYGQTPEAYRQAATLAKISTDVAFV
jgi:transcriptional regulator GlxA family with amidase domain